MKILIIDSYYDDFLKGFYQSNPNLVKADYQVQKRALLAEAFGTADFYSTNLNKLGAQAEEFIINNEVLQKQWAKEHGAKYSKAKFTNIPKLRGLFQSDWKMKVLEAQILDFKPNVIYSQDIYLNPLRILELARKRFGTKIVGQIASLMPPKELFKPYDLLVSSLPHFVDILRGWGKKAEYVPLAFESSLLPKLRTNLKPYDVTHVGGYGPIHNERNEILETASSQVKVDFWGYGESNLAADSPILKHFHGQAWGLDMHNVLHNSRITLGKHISQVADKYANNLTLFEATGCGALLLTDWKQNLGELFEVGKEIETYRTPQELIEKLRYYLTHEKQRQEIAQAGQRRTLLDHTWEGRMKTLYQLLQNL